MLVFIFLLHWVNCCYSIKLIHSRFSQEGIKFGCALFAFIPSLTPSSFSSSMCTWLSCMHPGLSFTLPLPYNTHSSSSPFPPVSSLLMYTHFPCHACHHLFSLYTLNTHYPLSSSSSSTWWSVPFLSPLVWGLKDPISNLGTAPKTRSPSFPDLPLCRRGSSPLTSSATDLRNPPP